MMPMVEIVLATVGPGKPFAGKVVGIGQVGLPSSVPAPGPV